MFIICKHAMFSLVMLKLQVAATRKLWNESEV